MQRVWGERNEEKKKKRDRRVNLRKYGLTFSDFDVLMSLGQGRCWICRKEPGRRALDIDHVHGKEPVLVRGLLCSACNVGIGLASRSPETLEALAEYVERARERDVDWFRTPGERHVRTPRRDPSGPKRPRWKGEAPEGQKWCSCCENLLPYDAFYPAKAGRLRLSAYCKTCTGDVGKRWDSTHREAASFRSMKTRLKLRFDVTPLEYQVLHSLQSGLCAGCGKEDEQGEQLAVDHDRSRGPRAVRGLLCRHCNIGLGAFQDSPALLRAAQDYLVQAGGREPAWWGKSQPDMESVGMHVKVSGRAAVEAARQQFERGAKTRADIARGFGITVQAAGELLKGKTWKDVGGPLVVSPGEHTPGWSSRERGDTHWTRRLPGRLPRGDDHHMRRSKVRSS